ncbi:ureidoglycolate lyase [Castellaniella sp.]|uniref:ureidoglycolate lyase n=1 Tax=Castellaniella sp. TaxID=1955812 RepID=UPI00356A7DF0
MPTPRILAVEPLSRSAFAPFGDVIQADEASVHYSINEGNTVRFHDLAKIDPGPEGRAIVSIFRGQARRLPFAIHMMERHPKASQAFIALSGRPWLAVVAPREAAPRAEDLRVFLCQPHQGVNYAPGVWHHPLLALQDTSDFLIIDRAGPGENCDIVTLAPYALIPDGSLNGSGSAG